MKIQKSIIAIIALFIFALTANAQLQYRKSLDFDGDNKADITVQRPGAYNAGINGYQRTLWTRHSSNNQARAVIWGFIAGYHEDGLFESDVMAPGDYDGDGKADYAAVRGNTNNLVWHILSNNGVNYRVVTFGITSGKRDVPMAADYDGDGKTDIAVARMGLQFLTITWHILRSSDGQHQAVTVPVYEPGLIYSCKAVAGDYDGDGKADLNQYCTAGVGQQAYFKIVRSSDNVTITLPWGTTATTPQNFAIPDMPAVGDYDGDGKSDLAVVRKTGPSENEIRFTWYIYRSLDNTVVIQQFGAGIFDQFPAQADYDGDGKTDIATWDEKTAIFYILQSSNGQVRFERWGNNAATNGENDIVLTNQPYNVF